MAVSGYGAPRDHAALTGLGVGDPHAQYGMVLVGAASARPAVGAAGLRAGTSYVATDTGAVTTYDGAAWLTPGMTTTQADAAYARLAADNLLSGRNTFTERSRFLDAVELAPRPENAFPTEYEPAGTNLVTNPSMEVDTTGWLAINGAAAPTRITTQAYVGGAALSVPVATGAVYHGARTATIPAVPGEVVTASAWLRADAAKNVQFYIGTYDAAGAYGSGTVVTRSIGTAWTRYEVTFVVPAGATGVALGVQNNGVDQGAYAIHLDGAQVERSPVATSYIDGSLGAGFAWTGAAHASTSTRAADTVARLVTDVATTNLVTNPSFETDIAGWSNRPGFTAAALARDTGDSRIGAACLRVDVGTAAGWYVVQSNTAPAAPGQTFSASAWIKTEPGRKLTLRIYEEPGGTVSDTQIAGTGEWERYTVSYPNLPAGTTGVTVAIYNTNGNEGGSKVGFSFWVDGVQLEQGNGTSYADGDLGDGYAWTGTPRASTSTRAAGTVIPPVVRALPPYGLVTDGPGRNLVPNPSFAVDLAGWRSFAGATIARSTGSTVVGAASASVVVAGAAYLDIALAYHSVPAQPGDVMTASFWVRASAAKTVSCILRWHDAAGSDMNGAGQTAIQFAATIQWRRVTITATAPANTTGARIIAENNGTDQGAYTFWISGVQLERGSVATSYIDGSLGSGYEWEGTPHASPSRRRGGTRVLSPRAGIYVPRSERALIGLGKSPASGANTFYSTTSTTAVAVDANNLFATFIGPESGRVLVHLMGYASGVTSNWGIVNKAGGAVVRVGAETPTGNPTRTFVVDVTPGQEYAWAWSWWVSSGTAYLNYGNAYGDVVMEVWAA